MNCTEVDIKTLSIAVGRRTFALQVLSGYPQWHIAAKDFLIFEQDRDPKKGDLVAALHDRRSIVRKADFTASGKLVLVGAPKDPLIPGDDLMIQGVMTMLIRKAGQP